jgi:NAD(P)-dependent dehydrogenase (short-subunit alcohol dehydrogenase family)
MRARTVLITGAGRGLGLELQRLYALRGWTTFPLVRKPSVAERFTAQWPQRCYPIVTDLTQDRAATAIRQVLEAHGEHLDVLINNAGHAGRSWRFDDLTVDELHTMLQVHCLGVVRATQAAIGHLRRAEHGKVVNITSRLGSATRNAAGEFAGKPFTYSYRMAKAAQNMFTLCLSQELSAESIWVYGIHPGRLLTDSGSYDADTPPDVAAKNIADWIEAAGEAQTGRCFQPPNGELPW